MYIENIFFSLQVFFYVKLKQKLGEKMLIYRDKKNKIVLSDVMNYIKKIIIILPDE